MTLVALAVCWKFQKVRKGCRRATTICNTELRMVKWAWRTLPNHFFEEKKNKTVNSCWTHILERLVHQLVDIVKQAFLQPQAVRHLWVLNWHSTCWSYTWAIRCAMGGVGLRNNLGHLGIFIVCQHLNTWPSWFFTSVIKTATVAGNELVHSLLTSTMP